MRSVNQANYQKIPIPTSTVSIQSQRMAYSPRTIYRVEPGDTIWGISEEFQVSAEKIMQANNLSSGRDLSAGTSLIIPASPIAGKNILARLSWPVRGEVIEFFGDKSNNTPSDGINIKALSAEVLSAAAGEVVFCGFLNGWGKTLVIRHGSDLYTVYANLISTNVNKGAQVTKATQIASISSSAGRCGVLHFQVRSKYKPENPLSYLE